MKPYVKLFVLLHIIVNYTTSFTNEWHKYNNSCKIDVCICIRRYALVSEKEKEGILLPCVTSEGSYQTEALGLILARCSAERMTTYSGRA